MGEVTYKFIKFDWPRKQCGVIVAIPPRECIVPSRVVAVANELDTKSPPIILSNLLTTVGMLSNIVRTINDVTAIDSWFYMEEWFKTFVTFTYLESTAELTRVYDDEILYTSTCAVQLGRQDDMRYAAVHYDCVFVPDNLVEHMVNELWSYR